MSNPTIDRRYSVAEGTALKAPVRCATTANITLSGLQAIDGVTVVERDRVLVKNQTNAVLNGIYEASTGNWLRTKDFDGARDVVSGTRVLVNLGSTNGLREFMLTTVDPITIDATSLVFTSRIPTNTDADARVLYPDQFNALAGTGNVAADTAAWTALAVAMRDGYTARARQGATYLIDSNLGPVLFSNLDNIEVDLSGAIFRQQRSFSRTMFFDNCTNVRVRRGYFYGYANIQILASSFPLTEYNAASTSYNGVAALYFNACDGVEVDGVRCYRHCGGGLGFADGNNYSVHDCHLEGIGALIQAGDLPADCCIILINNTASRTGRIYNYSVTRNRMLGHVFGLLCNLSRSLIFQGNNVGPMPGQHGVYSVECDGLDVTGNTFTDIAQAAFKMQHENYAGIWFGSAWASGTAYSSTAGDEVRFNNTLYVCIVSHTSGTFATDLAANKWRVSERMQLIGGVIANNVITRAGVGIGFFMTPDSYLQENFTRNLLVTGNTIRDTTDGAIELYRCIDTLVSNNNCYNSPYGLLATNFSGTIKGNVFHNMTLGGIRLHLCFDSWAEENLLLNCATAAPAVAGIDFPVAFVGDQPLTATPSEVANPKIFFHRNTVHFTSGNDAISTAFFYADARNDVSIMDTRTNSAKSALISGSVIEKWHNDFTGVGGISGGPPAEPTYTVTNRVEDRAYNANATTIDEIADVLGTVIQDLKDKKVFQ